MATEWAPSADEDHAMWFKAPEKAGLWGGIVFLKHNKRLCYSFYIYDTVNTLCGPAVASDDITMTPCYIIKQWLRPHCVSDSACLLHGEGGAPIDCFFKGIFMSWRAGWSRSGRSGSLGDRSADVRPAAREEWATDGADAWFSPAGNGSNQRL